MTIEFCIQKSIERRTRLVDAGPAFAAAIAGLRQRSTPYHLAHGLLDYAVYLAARGEVTPASLRKALYFAASLGSFCVEGIGPSRLLEIGRSDLGARIAAFARLVDHGGELALPA